MALRRDLSAVAGLLGCWPGPAVVGWTRGGQVLRRVRAVAGGVPVPVRGAKQRTCWPAWPSPGKPVSADRLIDALWGDGQVAHPVNALQAQIGQLRRTLGATAIVTSNAGDALDIGPMMSTRPVLNSWWQRGGGCLRKGRRRSRPPRWAKRCGCDGGAADRVRVRRLR